MDLRIVFHVSQADRWPAAVGSLQNVVRDYPTVGVRVVANGFGVLAYPGRDKLAHQLAELAARGVAFQACANALRERGIDPATLPPFVTVVPAGVIALAEAQRDGFAYIRP